MICCWKLAERGAAYRWRTTLAGLLASGVLPLILLCGLAQAAGIPKECAAHAPWGAPKWKDHEPAMAALCRQGYVALHDNTKLVPQFVSWELTPERSLGCLPRKDSFAPDPDLDGRPRAELKDYAGHKGVWDRGHFAPNADFQWDLDAQRESFYLSNMSPQASNLNQWQWEKLEAVTRAWAQTRGAIVIMDGPIWKNPIKTLGANKVGIPTAYWKVVVDPGGKEALAFIMKNVPTPKGDLEPYQVTVAEVDKAAQITVPLPAGVSRTKKYEVWDFDLAAFAKLKKQTCPAPKKKKK